VREEVTQEEVSKRISHSAKATGPQIQLSQGKLAPLVWLNSGWPQDASALLRDGDAAAS